MLDTYRTRQLPQAAFLLASGVRFLRVENTQCKYCDLVFEDRDASVERLADTYFQGAACSALRFYRALTELRIAIKEATGVRRG
jgi:hypothetical protein